MKKKKEIKCLKNELKSWEYREAKEKKYIDSLEKLIDGNNWKLLLYKELSDEGTTLTGWADENEVKQFEDINGTVKPFSTGNRTITLQLYNKKWETHNEPI